MHTALWFQITQNDIYKYDELKLINHVQPSEILLIENFTV